MTIKKRNPVAVQDAIKKVIDVVENESIMTLNIEDSLNYILAENVIATYDIPRFNKSPYDGFAIRSEDSNGANGDNRIFFKVVDHIGAGTTSDVKLGKCEAVRIMTGAQIPEGADAVVMFEQTTEEQQGFKIRKQFVHGENIAFKGEECKENEIVLNKGQMINSGVIAVLATFGYTKVSVYQRPTVAVIATGSELLAPDEPLQPGKIRNSNGPMIQALCQELNIKSTTYNIQEDNLQGCINIVEEALSNHDIVITTGGVSVGDYDYLPKVYDEINAEVLFNKVQMRPGSVTTVAYKENKLLFGLSGNPSACYSGFHLFTKPAILKMMNANEIYPPIVEAILEDDFKKANPFTRFIRAKITFSEQGMYATPAGFNKSNAVVAIAKSNGMIILPSGTRGYSKGDTVKVILTDHQSYERVLNL
ncbi:gephyrin-like molybdotransferase Glp [Mammaliicoccus stepanovicii]|uniref:Molybdopterin molybdenumtransferase n=1 Tax=Mammaliicoccus stepanovicii TaxID=643214 RepID=A0A239YI24_9STAP|nr:gephyrin-like molybdotransferase Glp [Mammaliicoccus stepanovicii]PNZ77894.1 molybdopterin molybdenumtransferase [Mammaliicoccus stepanovicii]GGI40961.1 molybdopterin molybdenumtransferase [Mammaliicoccus stepanovicii]SNV58921.1 molybdopterin biosynthesis protein moeA [Mammaliicoccus stepanovicii]